VHNFLKYIGARFRKHFIPGQNIVIDECVVYFKGKISFMTYSPIHPSPENPLNVASVSTFWKSEPPAVLHFHPFSFFNGSTAPWGA
jgi:hypothetical protein